MAGGKFRVLDEGDYVRIGRGFHSDDVAKEAAEAMERWRKDMEFLRGWGYGAKTLAAFVVLAEAHGKLRAARPEAISAKSNSLEERTQLIEEGWEQVNKTVGALSLAATRVPEIAADLNATVPTDDAALSAGVKAMAKLLTKHAAELDEEFDAASIVARADVLGDLLAAQIGAVGSAKQATKDDTREIDLMDGQVVVVIRSLNKTARKAFRVLGNKVKVQEYHYNHLARSMAKAKPEPAPGA